MEHILTLQEFITESAKFTEDKSIGMLAIYGLSLRNQIHVFHWQTEVGDMHKALGDFYDGFTTSFDNLMEVVMGKHGRFSVSTLGMPVALLDLKNVNPEQFIETYVQVFENYKNTTFSNDTEIKNIIEEIVASLYKLQYLLTMS
jgi:hypothetical protein